MEYDDLVGSVVDVKRVSEHTIISGVFRKFGDTYLVEVGSKEIIAYKRLLDDDIITHEGKTYVFRKSSSPITQVDE